MSTSVENDAIQMEEDDDEWEETTMVVEVNGVLDAESVRQAVSKRQVNLRRAETDKPILQVGNSVYTGTWQRTVGTDIILQIDNDNKQLKIISATDKVLKTEKALLTAASSNPIARSSTISNENKTNTTQSIPPNKA